MRFVLDVETEDWEITSSEGGFYDVVKVLHVHLSYVGSTGAWTVTHPWSYTITRNASGDTRTWVRSSATSMPRFPSANAGAAVRSLR